jgi:hypothetical protein
LPVECGGGSKYPNERGFFYNGCFLKDSIQSGQHTLGVYEEEEEETMRKRGRNFLQKRDIEELE